MIISEKPGQVYSIAQDNRPLPNAIITNMTFNEQGYSIAHYSLGTDTYIEPERYSHPAIYICITGKLQVEYKENDARKMAMLEPGGVFVRPAYMLCEFRSIQDCVYTEIGFPLDANFHQRLKEWDVFYLKNMLRYSEEGVSRIDLIEGDNLRLFLLAIQKGQTGEEVQSNGETIVTVLEGYLHILYNGREEVLHEGESFLIEDGVMHSFQVSDRCRIACLSVFDSTAG